VNRFLIRLLLVIALLYDCLGSVTGVKTQGLVSKDEQKSEHQIKQHDGYLKAVAEEPQSPVEVVFRSAPSSHRVAYVAYRLYDLPVREWLKKKLFTPAAK